MAEAGVPGFAFELWVGLVAPAKTPAATVRKLQDETAASSRLPEVRERLEGFGFEPSGVGGEAVRAVPGCRHRRLTAVAKAANIRAD